MGFFEFAVGAPAPHCVAAPTVEKDVGRGLKNEAGEVRDLAAVAAVVQPKQHFLNQIVDFVPVGSAPEEGAERLLVGE